MSFRIVYSGAAKDDLRRIYEYIAYELSEPLIASNQAKRIMENVRSLEKMPSRFRLYESEPWRSRGLHVVPVNNYLVFYMIDDGTSIVKIVRIMYGGRNIKTQLEESDGL